MKASIKVFLFAATLSLTVIYSKTISKEVIESYNKCMAGISIPSSSQICYQLASR